MAGLFVSVCMSVAGILGSPAAPSDGTVGCDPAPVGATAECIECLNKACGAYETDLENCGSSQQCAAAARAAYRLQKSLCNCDPVVKRLIGSLPISSQELVLEFLVGQRAADTQI